MNPVPINLNNLKNEMRCVPADSPIFLYVGVGAANNGGIQNPLPPEHYQQFPPFLQDLRNQIPNLHVFLLLLDPSQETPPRVAMDYNLSDKYQDGCHYQGNQLQAFVFRVSVYTEPDNNHLAHGLNITDTLRDLNEFAKANRVSLLYHDFSGRHVALVAEYFDTENANHLDQLIYGLSAREDHGCSFDLTQPDAYFPYRIDRSPDNNQRPRIKMFNYYTHVVNQTYGLAERELQLYPPEMRGMADIQKTQIVNRLQSRFKTANLSLLRQVRKCILDPIHAPEVDLYPLNQIPRFCREIFQELFQEKNYDLLFELLFNYSISELNIIVNLKKMEMTGEELLTFITMDEDPYKWYNTLSGLF